MSRGIIHILVSRFAFVLGGYVVHVFMARFLGPENYGVFGICIAIITVCYVLLGSGVRQVVAKSAAKYQMSAKYFIKKGLIIQLSVSLTLGLLLVVFARRISVFFHDSSLEVPLYLSAVIIVMQSLLYVYMGGLSGIRKFGSENALMSVYSFVKASSAILFVCLGLSVVGGLLGYLLASFVGLLLANILTRNFADDECSDIDLRDMVKGSIPVIVMFSSITFIMNIDLLAVKYFIVEAEPTGYYTAASAISKLAYWYFVAFGVVLLPFVSFTFHKNDIAQTRKYIREVIRYSLMFLLPAVVILCLCSDSFVGFIYGDAYEPAGNVLRILVWGILGLGLLNVFSNIMIGIERERIMVKYSFFGLAVAVGLNAILVPILGMIGGAISTVLTSLVFVIFASRYIVQELDMQVKVKGPLKVIFSLFVIIPVSYLLSHFDVALLPRSLILYFAYLTALILLKEIGPNDVNVVRRMIHGTAK